MAKAQLKIQVGRLRCCEIETSNSFLAAATDRAVVLQFTATGVSHPTCHLRAPWTGYLTSGLWRGPPMMPGKRVLSQGGANRMPWAEGSRKRLVHPHSPLANLCCVLAPCGRKSRYGSCPHRARSPEHGPRSPGTLL